MLGAVKTIAIVGAKDVSGHPVNMVGRYLLDAGYTVLPVHPKRTGVWGLPTYTDLASASEAANTAGTPIEVVNVFRAPRFCEAHARETLALAPLPRCFWMQSGITSAEAESVLADSSVTVVADACIKVVHARVL